MREFLIDNARIVLTKVLMSALYPSTAIAIEAKVKKLT